MNTILPSDSPFLGQLIELRALEEADLPKIMKHWNTYESRIGLGRFIPESKEQRKEWIKRVTNEQKTGSGFTFAIIKRADNSFLGTCSLRKINPISRTAFLSVAIHNPENHGKGYGTDVVKCILEIGFDILNLHRIELHVYEFLESARHIYIKLGFKEVGVRRKASYIMGEYRDDLVMDILEEEYRSRKL